MQNASKYHVRFPAIIPIQFLHQIFEPTIRPLNRVIKDFEARKFHAKWIARRVPFLSAVTGKVVSIVCSTWSTGTRRTGIIASALEEAIYGIQVCHSIRREGFTVARTGNNEQLLDRVFRSLEHPLGK